MGIKFRCPNGHKLNVKAFLAGKKGVCPKCGTRMRIPSASTEGGDSDIGETAAAALGVAEPPTGANGSAHPAPVSPSPVAAPLAPAPGPVVVRPAPAAPAVPVGVPVTVGSPVMTPAPTMPAAPATARPAVAMPAPMPAGAPVRPAMPAPMPSGPLPAGPLPPAVAAADPIAEAPAASWYVRPPSGVQYGPARGDVMRKWIAEGRVSADSLVWREGWADWQSAGKLFPNLAAVGGVAATPVAAVPSATATRSANRYQTKKKSGSGMAVAFLAVLAVVCVVLVGVLVYVLTTVK